MSRRLHAYTIGISIAALACGWTGNVGSVADTDPHVPRPRSKGEKARNRKHRGGRP